MGPPIPGKPFQAALIAHVFSGIADDRLIAAAPELYVLSERALAHLEQTLAEILESHCLLNEQLQPVRDTLEEDVCEHVERLEADIASARALLAKARGQ